MAVQDGRVVSNFIVQALQNKPLTVYGEGNQTRSFCYVADLISGLVAMMEKEGFIGPVNIGNPGEFSINELAHKIITLMVSRSEISHNPLPQDDPVRRCPDITLAKKTLGWKPQTPLDEGLKKTILYFQEVLGLETSAKKTS